MKAELIKVNPLMATDRMIQQARADIGTQKTATYGYYSRIPIQYTEYMTNLYFRARKQGDILEVCLYTRADLARADRTPRFRIFLDRENECHASYECAEDKWRTAKIDNLPYGNRSYHSPEPKSVASESTEKLVNNYLHTGCNLDIKQAVLDFQATCAGERLKRKYKLETDQIDYHMNMVPELPKDFDKFIHEYGFYNAQYIFYKDKSGYCTHCGREVTISKKPKHNELGKCSQCGSRITYKSWNKQKYCDTEHTVSIIQKCTDGESFVYRQFEVRRKLHRENMYIANNWTHEEYRVILDKNLRCCYEYEFGEYRNSGVNRWCKAGTFCRGYGYYNSVYSRSVLYHGNLKKLLSATQLKYIPLVEIIKSNPGRKWDVCGKIGEINRYDRFPYEVYWKMGLKQFVSEKLYDQGKLTMTDYDRTKPWDILKLTKEILNQAIKLNVTDQQMRILQRAHEVGVRLTDEQVIWLDTHMGVSTIMAYFRQQTPHKIIRFLKEQVCVEEHTKESKDTLHLYVDYLDMARELNWNMRDRGIFFPQDISRAHDEAMNILNAKKDAEEAAKRKQTDEKMHKNAEDIREVFNYTDDDYEIIVPEKYLDFKQEGNCQHNCVATYYDRAVEGKTIILFLRKKAEPDKSFCTVEVQNRGGKFAIVQNRIIYNKEAPDEAKAFMKKAVAEAQKTVEKLMKQKTKVTV